MIIFQKTGLPDLTIERGRVYPLNNPTEINQDRYLTESNHDVIVNYGNHAKFLELELKFLSKDNYDGAINGLKNWFESSQINYSENSFTLIDELGYSRTVRLWQGEFDMPENFSGRYSIKLTLKES